MTKLLLFFFWIVTAVFSVLSGSGPGSGGCSGVRASGPQQGMGVGQGLRTAAAGNILIHQPVGIEQVTLDSTVLGVETVVSGLEVPWEMAWGPDGCIWFTEQNGQVSRINPVTKTRKMLLKIPVYRKRLGLMSMAIHPDFKRMPYVFFNYLHMKDTVVYSTVVRYSYTKDTLAHPLTLLDFPAYIGHNGSRLAIAPDGKLMVAAGDGAKSENAQDTSLLNGKILRINIDGTIPPDNPIKGSPLWAWGFRVPQGMVYDHRGNLFTAEHGDATDDEVNLIKRGRNYGWPFVQGFCDRKEEKDFCKNKAVVEPLKAWTPTIAPAGMDFYNSRTIPEWRNALLLVTLKTQSLRVLKLDDKGTAVQSERVYFAQQYGRLRDVCVSPAGDVYISTSNRDWNPGEGYPKPGDDRIIRIFKVRSVKGALAKGGASAVKPSLAGTVKRGSQPQGALIYNNYCASCHKQNGLGVEGSFPPLKGTVQVLGDKAELIRIVLRGLSKPLEIMGKKYDQQMPRFDFLSDAEIAAVSTFVRRSFGNNASTVTAAEVSKVRTAGLEAQ